MVNTHASNAAVVVADADKSASDNENSSSVVKQVSGDAPAFSSDISATAPVALDSYDVARFWSRVEVRKQDQCWPWRFGANEAGYGEFRFSTRSEYAHRVAYRITHGTIPDGAVIRHQCDNPLCCNPAHLLVGTHEDNVADRVARDRSARGEDNGRAKLLPEHVRHIRESHLSVRYLARLYEVDPSTIQDIRSRKTWTHL